jgi:hypothetical protein
LKLNFYLREKPELSSSNGPERFGAVLFLRSLKRVSRRALQYGAWRHHCGLLA